MKITIKTIFGKLGNAEEIDRDYVDFIDFFNDNWIVPNHSILYTNDGKMYKVRELATSWNLKKYGYNASKFTIKLHNEIDKPLYIAKKNDGLYYRLNEEEIKILKNL